MQAARIMSAFGRQKHSSVPPMSIQYREQNGRGLSIQKVLTMEDVIIMTDAAK